MLILEKDRPKAMVDTSHSTMNPLVKSGNASTGADVTAPLSA
jgi:hypothetical protein